MTMNTQAVATRETSVNSVGLSIGSAGASIAPQNLGEVVRFAEVMARADIALPKHLRGNPGACMAVALQALEWQMSPFAVASKSYAVNGQIAYEAQLIAAVVNTRSGIKGRLKYDFRGEGDEMTCIVSGTLDGDECTYETPPVAAINPKNSPLWKTDPRQQLGYFAARSWARRHCPEVILGVYDRDEAQHFGPDDAKDVTPSVMARLQARQTAAPAEGFSTEHVNQQTGELLPETSTETESDPHPPSASDGGSGNGAGSVSTLPSGDPAAPPSREPGGSTPTQADARAAGAKAKADGMSLKAMPDIYGNDLLRSAYVDGFESGVAEDREPGADG